MRAPVVEMADILGSLIAFKCSFTDAVLRKRERDFPERASPRVMRAPVSPAKIDAAAVHFQDLLGDAHDLTRSILARFGRATSCRLPRQVEAIADHAKADGERREEHIIEIG